MSRLLPRLRLVPIAVALSCIPLAAHARDEEAQLWVTQNIAAKADRATTISIDLNQRARSSTFGGDQYLNRITLDHAVAKGVVLGFGAAYQYNDREKEIRTFQQITLSKGVMSSRTRLEQRMFETGPDVVWRLVERVQVAQPLDRAKRWTAVVNADLFFQLSRAKPTDPLGLTQIRTQAGLRRQVNDHLSIQATYMRQQSLRPGRPDTVAHAPWVTLFWKI